ncbi:hypothetical protein EON80_03830 [bacterium]|nr:MAG: hypothetical protein EON80_03830 [bacterium]
MTETSPAAGVATRVDALKCEQLVDPIALNNGHPTLSWQLASTAQGRGQKAYRVLVAGSLDSLKGNKGDYWDSGKVVSANSTMVTYAGLPLESRARVFWKVMIWDEQDIPSRWSSPASWAMGLLQSQDWSAKWIGALEDPDPDSTTTYPAPYFRKEFQTAKKITKATAYISGLGFYELSINGKKIGDQVLAPAVTNYDRRPLKRVGYPYDDQSTQRVFYNTFDVSHEIKQGANCIGVILGNGWYNQRERNGEGTMWYDVPRLIFQLEVAYADGSTERISSDNSWKTSTGPLLHDGIYSGEKYDARLELGDWQSAGYDDASWKPSLAVRPPTGKLEAQTAPFDKVARTLTPTLVEKNVLVSKYRLGELVAGWPSIRLQGNAGSQLKIRYISEEGQDYGQSDTYILKGGGVEAWHPRFTWHAFRDVEITASDASIILESLSVEDVHTAVPGIGTFECSNPLFNKIHEAYLRTQRANFHGSLSSDCPHRERLGYTGDAQVIMESTLYAFDSFQFYRKWFNDMDDARNKKTGFVTHTAPFAGGGGGPPWGSAYVIMPWSYFNRYGDASLLRQHYAGMKQWVEYLQTKTDEKGLIVREEPNGWCLGDWCTPTKIEIPEPFVNTAYFYHVTELMAKAAHTLGEKYDEAKFTASLGKIKADFNAAYYDDAKKCYWEGRQGSDAFALAFGLVPDEKITIVFNAMVERIQQTGSHFDTGIMGTPLLLNVLSRYGRDDIAFQLMNQRDFPSFSYLLDDKNSTLWENWNGAESHCHPMFGSVAAWFYKGLGGIKADPASPGMQHFVIEPKTVADLESCKTSYHSLYGEIRSEWRKIAGNKHEFAIKIPANSLATFVLSGQKRQVMDEKGKSLPVQNRQGKSFIEFKSGFYRFTA